jgi:hypothetical protein
MIDSISERRRNVGLKRRQVRQIPTEWEEEICNIFYRSEEKKCAIDSAVMRRNMRYILTE